MSRIEWTDRTWNPVTGCNKVSQGCKHCYAEVMALRLQAMGLEKYKNGFEVTLHEDLILEPTKWKKPSMIFVCSMADLFHEKVPYHFIDKVRETIIACPQHTFQILTKRASRIYEYDYHFEKCWPRNAWVGVSVESAEHIGRIEHLRMIDAPVRFLSLEPLLGPLPNLDLSGIHWVIVGGESGPGARPMQKEWVLEIKDACEAQNVPFFFKQWGGTNKKAAGRVLDGFIYDGMPEFY